jgi:hypothetical protein
MGGPNSTAFGHSDTRTLAFQDVGTFDKWFYFNAVAGGKVFFDDIASGGYSFKFPVRVWGRQWNNEGQGNPKAELDNEAMVWAFGVKSEGGEGIYRVGPGSRLEMYAGFMYSFGVNVNQPLITQTDGAFSGTFVTISYVNGPFDLLVRDARDGNTLEFRKGEAIGRGWGSVVPLYVSVPAVDPSADAYVRDGSNANTNYGGAADLVVKRDSATNSGFNRQAYLKFDTATLTGPVGKAILRVYGKFDTGSGGTALSAYAVPTTWSETGITWNNRPALGAKQGGSVTVTPTVQYYEFDVSAYVRSERAAGRTTVSFALTGDAGVSPTTTFSSRTDVKGKPQLLLMGAPTTRLNAGGGATGDYADDNTNLPVGNTGTYFTSDPIDTTGVSIPAPQGVYQSERNDLGGGFTYTFGGLGVGVPYRVRLHFAERYFDTTGSRVFNVGINGATVLSNFDIRANARAKNKAIATDFLATSNANGQIVIGFASVTDRALVNAVEILPIAANGVLVNGTGLKGEYFNNETLSGSPALTRLDPTVNFVWGSGQPDGSVWPDGFSARWTGQVQPQFTETYTFIAQVDDGVRLWVNGQLVIDQWNNWGRYAGTITLNAGQKYDIRMEYREVNNHAQAQLLWSSASQPEQAIPQERLYPAP